MTYQIFISYASEDKKTADALRQILEDTGLHCWIAPRDIPRGENYARCIIDGINACQVCVVVFSGHANGSHFVMGEIERAFSRKMPILLFRLENIGPNADLQLFLSTTQWLDAFPSPLETYFEDAIASVSSLLNQPLPEKPKKWVHPKKWLSKLAMATAAALIIFAFLGWQVFSGGWVWQEPHLVFMSETDRQFLKTVATDIAGQLGAINNEMTEVLETQRLAKAFYQEGRATGKLPEPNEFVLWLDYRQGQLDKLKIVPQWTPDWAERLEQLGIPGNDAHSLYENWLPSFWTQTKNFYAQTRQTATMPPIAWLKEQDHITDLKAELLLNQAEALYFGTLELFNAFPKESLENFNRNRPLLTQLPTVGALSKEEAEAQMQISLRKMEEKTNALAAITGQENIGEQILEKQMAALLHKEGQVGSLHDELEASRKRLREKCRLLPGDPPGIMWSKMLSLRKAKLLDDARQTLDQFLALNKKRDINAADYVASAKAYYQNESAYPDGLGVLVVGIENNQKHAVLHIGDILLAKNGIKLAQSVDYLKVPQAQESHFDLLRLQPDGAFQRMELVSYPNKNPGITIAELREPSG